MSARNGDRSRHGRLRKQRIRRREANRVIKKELLAKIDALVK